MKWDIAAAKLAAFRAPRRIALARERSARLLLTRGMMTDTSSPQLLGRFSAAQHQHQHLHGLFTRLSAMCDALSADPPLTVPPELEPTALIGEWSVELSGHFAAEEGIRYFGTLATERPALVATIADLRADHAAMLEEIEQLTLIAADPARRRDLVTQTRALMAQLRAHESAENAMLKEFFEDPSHAET